TPYEVFFLSKEFNNMAQKVNDTYKELQQANEQLSKIDQIKSNLIDTVSHEFRTPLTSIKGHASRLLRNDVNIDEETKTKSLKVIKQQTERLNRLIEDLLVIPDIEFSLLRIFPDEINLKNLFETCISFFQQKQEKIISFSIEDDFPTVYADPDRVEQAVINLIDNAIKYSPENSEIKIKINKTEKIAIIKIQNESSPIAETVLNSLFDKFARIDNNLTRTTRGTGLGLFITKGLIEAMGGKINLSSHKYFEVCFTLPLKKNSVSENC
ncbi:MAG: ATP-binding protein, partial [bacterium]